MRIDRIAARVFLISVLVAGGLISLAAEGPGPEKYKDRSSGVKKISVRGDLTKDEKDAAILIEIEKMLYGFKDEADFPALDLKGSDDKLLLQIAEATWGYFRDITDSETSLPLDNIKYISKKEAATYTTTTNMGLYMISVICARQLGFIEEDERDRRIKGILDTIDILEKYEGHLFNYYDTIDLSIGRQYISSVDNGWLAAGLIVIKNSIPDFKERIEKLLNETDFGFFYDKKIRQLYLGYEVDKKKYSEYHYGIFNAEARVSSYIGIAKGDIPDDHWFGIYRTLPEEWTWQAQKPKGKKKEYGKNSLFQGYYEYKGTKFLPTWGGSVFEFAMPLIVLDEMNLAKMGFAQNHMNLFQLHLDFAKDKGYEYWGLSPCFSPDAKYREWGSSITATQPYPSDYVFTPHASFLMLPVGKKEAMKNIRKMLAAEKGLWGPYGFYDSFFRKNDESKIAKSYLCLDQAMILIPITNTLKDNVIVKAFHSEKGVKEKEYLLSEEDFFNE